MNEWEQCAWGLAGVAMAVILAYILGRKKKPQESEDEWLIREAQKERGLAVPLSFPEETPAEDEIFFREVVLFRGTIMPTVTLLEVTTLEPVEDGSIRAQTKAGKSHDFALARRDFIVGTGRPEVWKWDNVRRVRIWAGADVVFDKHLAGVGWNVADGTVSGHLKDGSDIEIYFGGDLTIHIEEV